MAVDIDKRTRTNAKGQQSTYYRVRYRSPDGRQREKTFARKEDAKRWATDNAHAAQHGAWVDPAGGKVLLGQWAERWFATKAAKRPATRRVYRQLLDGQVLPAFGSTPLARIDALQVEEWTARLAAGGLSPSRVRLAKQVLGQVLASAVKGGKLARNVAEGVKVEKGQRAEMLFLDAGQVERLADAIRPPYGVLVLVASYSGLRAAELAALRVGRLNLLKETVEVVEQATEVAGKITWGPTKSGERRTVRLPRFLCGELAAYLADRPHGPDALVFAMPDGGPLRQTSFVRAYFRPAVRAAGLPEGLRFHDLRHTAASLMIASGAYVKAVQRQLGHASAAMTLDVYAGLFPEDLDAVADRLDAVRTAATAAKGGADVGQAGTVRSIATGQSARTG